MQMYFTAIVLPQHLDEKIFLYKKWMQEKYNCKVGLKSPAHITISPPFWMDESKEQALIHDVEKMCAETVAFDVTTNNFSAFAQRTLFIAVEENQKLKDFKQRSDAFFRNSSYGMKSETRPFHPHITIATRDLHKKDFLEAWDYFKNKIFREDFLATGLSLLKHNGKVWEVAYMAKFGAA
ncbi:MAG TPA: 2'-5' RNA ligase family protein [Flavisolibacter sp.]|jgi:2'-5' RNA ligase|nr:2'-5' RNA ligase family protein [Flavisolibacter sp.]